MPQSKRYERMHVPTNTECDIDCWEGFIYGDSKCRHNRTHTEAQENYKGKVRKENCPYCLVPGSGIMSTGSELDECFCKRKQ